GARPLQGRPDPVRRRGRGGSAADDRSRARRRSGRQRRLLQRLRRHRDRRRDRDGRPGRPALRRHHRDVVERARTVERARVVRHGRPEAVEHARLDPVPLRRPPDPRLAGANKAKAAGIPVYTVALGTTGQTSMRGFPGGFPGNPQGGNGGFSYGFGLRGLAPDPKTLRAIAVRTGGKFYRAKTAGTVQSVYSSLGSRIGRKPGNVEITDWFLIAGAGLLLLGGVLSALWSPKLP